MAKEGEEKGEENREFCLIQQIIFLMLLLLLSLFITADLRSAKRFPARLLYNPYIVSMCETEERGGSKEQEGERKGGERAKVLF